MLNRLLHLEQAIFSNILIINCLWFSSVGTAAEVYGIRLLKASSAAQSEGCSACFVLVIKWSEAVFADHGAI